MLNVLKLLFFALTTAILSCADYPELNLSIIKGEGIEDSREKGVVKTYKTVIIGNQEWMAENLNYAGDGDTIGKCYGDSVDYVNTVNCQNLGRLYTWAEAMKLNRVYDSTSYNSIAVKPPQGICPKDWHLPSYDEWIELLEYVGYKEGLKLKTTSGWETIGHIANNGTDERGFSALPAGCHYENEFQKIKVCGAWWSNTEIGVKNIKSIQICNDDAERISFLKASWASVRCVRD